MNSISGSIGRQLVNTPRGLRSAAPLATMALLIGAYATSVEATSITEYPVSAIPVGITSGPDGNLWFGDGTGQTVGRITPTGIATQFTLPGPLPLGIRADSEITVGPDNNLWFNSADDEIGRITPAGLITLFRTPSGFSHPQGIAKGPDGNLWFVEQGANSIGKITPAGAITEFAIPSLPANSMGSNNPAEIAAGPDGNLWFTETSFQQCGIDFCAEINGKIGRITPSGVVTEFPLPTTNRSPSNIAKGPDGNLWFTEIQVNSIAPFNSSGGMIGRITPAGGITEFPIPSANAVPQGITTGPDGNLWFTETQTNHIAKVTPAGVISEFAIPTADSRPSGITTGPDGNLWFTETAVNKIGKLSLSTASIFLDGYMSGNWYDPAQSGQGFQLEMATGNAMVAIWFTFAPDGSGQKWIYADGSYDNTRNAVTLQAVLLAGAKFPPNFKSSDVTREPWGTLTFSFTDCNNGTASWSSTLPGYGSGSLPITRLTRIQGSACP